MICYDVLQNIIEIVLKSRVAVSERIDTDILPADTDLSDACD